MKIVISGLDEKHSSDWFVALSCLPIFLWIDSSIGNILMSYHVTKKLIYRYSLIVTSFAIIPIWILSDYLQENWVWGLVPLVLSRSLDRYFLAHGNNRFVQIVDLLYPVFILFSAFLGLDLSISLLVIVITLPRLMLSLILIVFINENNAVKSLNSFAMPRFWLFLLVAGMISLISTNIDTLLLSDSVDQVLVFTAISRFFIIFTAISGLSLELFKDVVSKNSEDFYFGVWRLLKRIIVLLSFFSLIIFFIVFFGVPYMIGIPVSAGFILSIIILRVMTFIPEFIAVYFFTKNFVLEHSIVLLVLGLISITIKVNIAPDILCFYVINGFVYGLLYMFYFYIKLRNGKLRKT